MFEKIKSTVTVKDAAEHYGLDVSRTGKCSCPFHDDDEPSMKLNEDFYYCFSCGAGGDIIDLMAGIFKLSKYQAALKLCKDFGIECNASNDGVEKHQNSPIQSLRKLTNDMCRWKRILAPIDCGELLDPYFVFACVNLEQAEHILSEKDAEAASEFMRRFNESCQGGHTNELRQ